MNIVSFKLFVQGYYAGNGTMKPVKNNQDGVSPTNEVETVTATLWAGANAVETATATLQTDGTATFEFESSGNYHASVRGVNSLEVFTPVVLTVGTTPVSYDFTIASSQAHGSNQIEVETNVFALYSGDINQDGVINQADIDLYETAIANSDFGVQATDLNGDGGVDNQDTDYASNVGKSVSRP